MGDIDTAAVDSLKTLDPKRPIREADVVLCRLRAISGSRRNQISGIDSSARREGFAPATETAEICSALQASKSIQLQIAAVSSCALTPSPSLLRGTRRRNVLLAEIGKIRAHQPHIGRYPIAEGRVRGQRENHVHRVVAEAAAVEGGKAE